MDTKKQYYYDYNKTVTTNPTPVSTSTSTSSTPGQEQSASIPPNTQDIMQGQTPPTYTPPAYDLNDDGVKKSNIIPLVVVIFVISIIGFLVWNLMPKNYQDCINFPGSSTSNTPPFNCNTFYGANFTNDAPIPSTTPSPTPENTTISPTVSTTNPQPIPNNQVDTTKGGQPLPSPTLTNKSTTPSPTVKVTPRPTNTPPQNQTGGSTQTFDPPIDWTKHTYPTQKFVIYMPKNYHPSSALQNNSTHITTIATTKDNYAYNPIITLKLQPNWQGYEAIKTQSASFRIHSDTGVIKNDADQNVSHYFFVRNNQVWIFSVNHQGNNELKTEGDNILKSIRFI